MNSLITYLNDHLAGSVGALEMLDHQIAASEDAELREFLTTLRMAIDQDQQTLKELLKSLGGEESNVRQFGAWLLEKLSRAKLHEGSDLGFVQAFEALSLGIWGKRALWRTLAVASRTIPQLRQVDYDALQRRAEDQFAKVEVLILETAPSVLAPLPQK